MTEQILKPFQRLLEKKRRLAAQITTKEQAARRAQDQDIVAAASTVTVESIVKDLADLQLSFDREIDALAATLRAETAKLERLCRAIDVETLHLQELEHIEIAAAALDILQQQQQAEAQAFQVESASARADLEQQIASLRAAWHKEEQEHQAAVASAEQARRKERSQAQADFAYDLERKQKIEADKFEAEKRAAEARLAETEREKQAQWAERENVIAAQKETLTAYRAQVETFAAKLQTAVQQAREQAYQNATRDAQVKTDLFHKEIEANRRVRELNIQTLEETIAQQAAQIEVLSAELRQAHLRAQSLAAQAIGGASGEAFSAEQPETRGGK